MEPESSDKVTPGESPQPAPEQAPADQSAERGGLWDFLKGLIVFAVLMAPLLGYLIRLELRRGMWADAPPPITPAPTTTSAPAGDDATTQPATAPAQP